MPGASEHFKRAPAKGNWLAPLNLLGYAAILVNFWWFSYNAIHTHFAADEMMNMGWAWRDGPAKILTGIIAFWAPVYRPTGALYYWILHHFFGLNPLPFRIVDLAFLTINLALAYGIIRRLTESDYVAWLGTFVFSYHTSISLWTTYNGAFVYDRLCFTFYGLALFVYLGLRKKDEGPRLTLFALVVACYCVALGAKEMAVSLPVVLAVYEVLYHPAIFRSLRQRESRYALGRIAFLSLMTLIFIVLKVLDKNSALAADSYGPKDVTLAHFFRSHGMYMNELIFRPQAQLPLPNAILVFAVMLLLCIVFRSKGALFSTAWVVITPLPIAFLSDRGGGCLYIVYLGWALFVAILSHRIALAVASLRPRSRWLRFAALALLAYPIRILASKNDKYQHYVEGPALGWGAPTWSVIKELDRVRPHFDKGSSVAYLHTPIEGWDVYFITQLWCRDSSVQIYLNPVTPLSKEQLRDIPIVLDFDSSGTLRQSRPQ